MNRLRMMNEELKGKTYEETIELSADSNNRRCTGSL